MSISAFGATTRLPLADCPFKRSALTPEAAEQEKVILDHEVRYDVTAEPVPVVVVHPVDEELLRRPGLPERDLQELIVAAEEPVHSGPAFTFRGQTEIVDAEVCNVG